MATEIREFQVKTPAGTALAAPLITDLTMPDRVVEKVEIVVPPGPRGVLGFALGAAGTPIIPTNPGAWIISDNERIAWALDNQIISGAWQLISYNTGTYDHTLYIRFLVSEVPDPSTGLGDPIPASQLSGAPPAPVPV